MDLTPRLLKPGHICTAFGQVVSADGLVTFRPGMAEGASAPRRRPRHRDEGFPVSGVDLDDLMFRFELDGALEGLATMTVVWQDGLLEVLEQRAHADLSPIPTSTPRMVRPHRAVGRPPRDCTCQAVGP